MPCHPRPCARAGSGRAAASGSLSARGDSGAWPVPLLLCRGVGLPSAAPSFGEGTAALGSPEQVCGLFRTVRFWWAVQSTQSWLGQRVEPTFPLCRVCVLPTGITEENIASRPALRACAGSPGCCGLRTSLLSVAGTHLWVWLMMDVK